MKSITRAVHLSSVVQSEFYGATRILFVHKENKNIERKQRTLFCICFNASNSTFIYALIWIKISYPCVEEDAEERTLLTEAPLQPQVFFCLMLQALLINIWQLSAICLLISSPLKLCQVGWGQMHIFRFLQKYLIGFKRRLWLGHSKTFTALCIRHSCCALRVIVLLKGEPSAQSEVLNALNWVFIKAI